ncbi:MAG: methionine--tRNA ligase [Puniceicoccales bacterium]|jgi:methionyl-tRNA synthetase|nr:methionine--tRNA ligase [Puniceicoccales bacterium]
MKPFYLTTAIDYANGHPHIGHAYEKILADVICRTKRLLGYEVHFLTGLDEHGQKVEQTARERHITPQELCDATAQEFIETCALLNVSYDDYIRTTEPRHKIIVGDILRKLFEKGDIYKAEYSGFYSTRVERFLQEKDKVDGIWPETEFGQVTEITEVNYFFKLKQHRAWLIDYINDHGDFIFPKFRAKQVLEFLKDDINDLCISRPKNRLSWGIELPFDREYVTYVWFDALINYISAIGYGGESFNQYWPVDYHVIGKDILVPAHSIYWPIMLHALDLPMPKTLLAHGWWLCSGEKMSKSVGNVVDPIDYAKQFGADAFRYFVLREMNVGQDSDFSHERFIGRYNNDLANDLGNLLSRNSNMLRRYANGVVPTVSLPLESLEREMVDAWEQTQSKVLEGYEQLQFHSALENIFAFIAKANRFLEMRAPWKLAKSNDPKDLEMLHTTLAVCSEAVRLIATILIPIMPGIGQRILSVFAIDQATWGTQLNWDLNHLAGRPLAMDAPILFPRIA